MAQTRSARRGNGWTKAAWVTAALMLLAPLVAMQFTDEVNWGLEDFVTVGAMLLAACGTFELATRMRGSGPYQAAVGVAVGAAFLLVLVQLAVGIIGDGEHPANLMFAGVLAVGLVGAVLARFRPAGMARAMVATALVQGVAGVVALVLGSPEGFLLSGFYVGVWLLSAWLFRKAHGGQPPQVARPQAA